MDYLIAAYGVTLVSLGAYLLHLVRERRRLCRSLAGNLEGGPSSRM